jgi:hypothetical protein
MEQQGAFERWGRHALAAGLGGLIAWFAFVANRPVPILDWFDLGIHEVGHLLAAFMPRMLMFIAGSFAQIALPLGLAWYFGIFRRDAAGGGFCLAWAGTSMWDVSVYIADAPIQALPLVGGGQHDWAYLLGPQGWNVMHLSDEIAGFIEFTGGMLAVAGVAIALGAAWRGAWRKPEPVLRDEARVSEVTVGEDPWIAAADLPFHHRSSD